LQQITVLYVEDHDLVLFTVKQLLELEGWHVHICRDGKLALKLIAGEEHFDLIILDAELPSVSGFDLIRRVRNLPHRESTPVIVFSARDCHEEAKGVGADACLKKPGGIKDLLETCNRVLKLAAPDAGEADGQRRAVNSVGRRRD
jgi:DNA-binding response OmpR family regulator